MTKPNQNSTSTKRRRRRRRRLPRLSVLSVFTAAAAMIMTGWRTDFFAALPPAAHGADETPLPSASPPAAKENERRVSLIYQNPELPNGCEATSLAMLLGWAGYPIDKTVLAGRYLPKEAFVREGGDRFGPDPSQAYAGDPFSAEGWYCFENPIVYAGNAWLREQNSSFRTVSLTGLTRRELEEYLAQGIPLAVWATLNYAPPRYSSFQWRLPGGAEYIPYSNLHCVVLAGWSGESYQIADPISGWQRVSPALFWSSFDAMGRRAAAVLPD